jgi:hypothetical protein
MRFRRTVPILLLLTALLTAAITGCSQLPTNPATTSQASPGSIAAARSAESAGLLSTAGSLLNGLATLIVRTLQLVGSVGGSLTNGRWRVVLPPDAVEGNVTIALAVPDATSPDCQLEIWPADRNHFSKPVTLIADCRNVSNDRLRTYIIYWYNPDTRKWVPVPGSTVDLTTKTVRAPLSHFSKYAVGPQGGRAGW